MTVEPMDLEAVAAWVSRPGATPAPQWTAVAKPCCGEVLDGEDCDCADLAAQLEQANRRPIWFGTGRRAA